MTTVVGIHTPGKGTIIAADTQVTLNHQRMILRPDQSKISYNNEWACAVAGNMRMCNVINANFNILFKDLRNIDDLPDRLIEVMNNTNANMNADDEAGFIGNNQYLVVGSANGIWFLDSTFAVLGIRDNQIISTGSGSEYVIGYVEDRKLSEEALVLGSLSCAIKHDVYSGGNISMVKLLPAKGKNDVTSQFKCIQR